MKPADNFNAADDAETLKKAMKGFGKEVEFKLKKTKIKLRILLRHRPILLRWQDTNRY